MEGEGGENGVERLRLERERLIWWAKCGACVRWEEGVEGKGSVAVEEGRRRVCGREM